MYRMLALTAGRLDLKSLDSGQAYCEHCALGRLTGCLFSLQNFLLSVQTVGVTMWFS